MLSSSISAALAEMPVPEPNPLFRIGILRAEAAGVLPLEVLHRLRGEDERGEDPVLGLPGDQEPQPLKDFGSIGFVC